MSIADTNHRKGLALAGATVHAGALSPLTDQIPAPRIQNLIKNWEI